MIWILGVVVILMLIVLLFALRVPTTFRGKTKKGEQEREFEIITKPPTQMKAKKIHYECWDGVPLRAHLHTYAVWNGETRPRGMSTWTAGRTQFPLIFRSSPRLSGDRTEDSKDNPYDGTSCFGFGVVEVNQGIMQPISFAHFCLCFK